MDYEGAILYNGGRFDGTRQPMVLKSLDCVVAVEREHVKSGPPRADATRKRRRLGRNNKAVGKEDKGICAQRSAQDEDSKFESN